MFQRYSMRALRVIFSTRRIASLCGATEMTVALLAKALVEEDGAFVAGPEQNERWSPPLVADALVRDLDALLPAGKPVPTSQDMPLSDGTEAVFERAEALRVELNRKEISPLVMLAALLDTETGPVREAFARAGVTRESVKAALSEQS